MLKLLTRSSYCCVPFAALAVLIAATGCGSSGSSSNSTSTASSSPSHAVLSVTRAQHDVAVTRQPLVRFAGPSVAPARPPRGKTVVVIYSVPAPQPERAAQGVANAARAAGWQARVVNGEGTPAGWANAINTAIGSHASAIVLTNAEPRLVAPEIQRAQQAGIPVVSAPECDASLPQGVIAQIALSEDQEGYRLGEWVVANASAGTKILVLRSPEFTCLQQATTGFMRAISQAGSKYQIVDQAVSPSSDITSSQGPQRIAALLQKNPDAKYIFVLSESWAGVLTEAEHITGRHDVTGLGTDGDFFIPEIKKGANFVEIGPDTLQDGWYAVDALIRFFNHKPRVKYQLPFRLIDRSNAASVQTPGISSSFNFAADWEHLWGTQS